MGVGCQIFEHRSLSNAPSDGGCSSLFVHLNWKVGRDGVVEPCYWIHRVQNAGERESGGKEMNENSKSGEYFIDSILLTMREQVPVQC